MYVNTTIRGTCKIKHLKEEQLQKLELVLAVDLRTRMSYMIGAYPFHANIFKSSALKLFAEISKKSETQLEHIGWAPSPYDLTDLQGNIS